MLGYHALRDSHATWFRDAGPLTTQTPLYLQVVPERAMAMLALTAFHDVMKVSEVYRVAVVSAPPPTTHHGRARCGAGGGAAALTPTLTPTPNP